MASMIDAVKAEIARLEEEVKKRTDTRILWRLEAMRDVVKLHERGQDEAKAG